MSAPTVHQGNTTAAPNGAAVGLVETPERYKAEWGILLPIPPAATAPAPLSPSQAACFLECPFRWYGRYRLQEPEQPTAALGIGRAVHQAIAAGMARKMTAALDNQAAPITSAEIAILAEQCWETEARELPTAERTPDARSQTVALTRLWWDVAAPELAPIAIEQHTAGIIAGIPVHGIVDLVAMHQGQPVLIDVKTASKKPSAISPAHLLQLGTYATLRGDTRARLDTLTRTKTPAIHQVTHDITDADRAHVAAMYPMVAQAIADQLYYPRRSSNLCSRRYCASWRTCEREFGGTVRD